MVQNLKLDFVGCQARQFGGQLLGLPVIGLPGNKPINLTPISQLKQDSSKQNIETADSKVFEVFKYWDRNRRRDWSENNEQQMSIKTNLLDESNNHFKADTLQIESGRKDSEIQDSSPKQQTFELDESYLSSINKIQQQQETQAKPGYKSKQPLTKPPIYSLQVKQFQLNYKPQSKITGSKQAMQNFKSQSQQRLPALNETKIEVKELIQSKCLIKQSNKAKVQPLKKCQSQEIIIRKLQLGKIHEQNQIHVEIPSSIQQFSYQVITRDQYVAKYLREHKFEKVKGTKEIAGVILAKQGKHSKAQSLLAGRNLCLCYLEMEEYSKALKLAEVQQFSDIVQYIETNKQSQLTQSIFQDDNLFNELNQQPVGVSQINKQSYISEKISSSFYKLALGNRDQNNNESEEPSNSMNQSQVFPLFQQTVQAQTLPLNSQSLSEFKQYLKFNIDSIALNDQKCNTNLTSPLVTAPLIQFKKTIQQKHSQSLKQILKSSENEDQTSIIDKSNSIVKQNSVKNCISSNIHPAISSPYKSGLHTKEPTSKQSFTSFKSKVQDFRTKELLQSLVQQSLADIERFKFQIGGQENMDKFIIKYAKEWRSGSIQQQNKNIRERPWASTIKQDHTAYDLAQTKYASFKATINLLVENYLKEQSDLSPTPLKKDTFINYSASSVSSPTLGVTFNGSQSDSLNFNHPEGSQTLHYSCFKSPYVGLNQRFQSSQKALSKQQSVNELNSVLKEFQNDFELNSRLDEALRTIKQRIETPRIEDIMKSEMNSQDIYNFTKTAGHLEKLLNDSKLSNADSERLDPNFWSKMKITHRSNEKQDLFYINEEANRELCNNFASCLTQNYNQKPSNQSGCKNYQEHFTKLVDQWLTQTPTSDVDHVEWLNKLWENVSVSDTLQNLLKFRMQELTTESNLDAVLGSGGQPRGSILMLIREQFAKLKLNEATHKPSKSKAEFKLLSTMLSKINYFSHFDTFTRQKLIEISKHVIYKAGSTLLHSDELGEKIIVVISGAVSVLLKDRKFPDDFERVRHTLYPGDSIGDAPLRLILTSDTLHFSLKAAVDSDVLLINKKDIPEILKEEILTLLHHKIMPLQRCTLFAGEDHQSPYTIFVLANLVTIQQHQYGEVIQRQGSQADDSMYLVVRGYCRAVFESTLTNLAFATPKKRFCNSKESYGELGIIANHNKTFNPRLIVKNVRSELVESVKKMQPGYLPGRKRVIKIMKKQTHPKRWSNHLNPEWTDQVTKAGHVDLIEDCQMFSNPKKVSRIFEAQNSSFDQDSQGTSSTDNLNCSMISNRTEKKQDLEALVGHQNDKLMETSFEVKQLKDQIVENEAIAPTIKTAGDLKKVLSALNFTEETRKIQNLKDETKLTAHLDLVEYQKSIGVGEIFCCRALLDEGRCVKNLQLELNEFLQQQGKANTVQVKESTEEDRLQKQLKLNDSKLPADLKQFDGKPLVSLVTEDRRDAFQSSSHSLEFEQPLKAEPRDPIWQKIFTNLRKLLGDAELKKKTAVQLFKELNQSQLTIIADSSDLVLLRIREQDLIQLSEPVRRRIERDIMNKLFVDIDRPFTSKEQLNQFIWQYKNWYKQRQAIALEAKLQKGRY